MEERLGRQLALTAKAMQGHFDAALGQVDGSLPSWVALNILMVEDGLSQSQLALRMHLESPTLTRHLDRWVADGLIARQRDAVDRRIVRVRLTDAGRRRYERMAVVANQQDARLRGLMSEREIQVLRSVLARIHRHVTTPEEDHVDQTG
jgi:DNA-binding MarR family transcriptional regulator